MNQSVQGGRPRNYMWGRSGIDRSWDSHFVPTRCKEDLGMRRIKACGWRVDSPALRYMWKGYEEKTQSSDGNEVGYSPLMYWSIPTFQKNRR